MHGYTRSLLQCPVWIPGTGTVYGEFGNKPFPIVNLFPRTRKKEKNSFGSPTLSFWFGIRSHRSDLAGLAKKRTSVQTGIARSKRPLVRFKHPFLAHFLSVQNRPDSQKDILIRQKSLWVGNVLLKGKKDFCLEKKKVGESLLPGALYWVLVPRQTPCVRVRYFHAPCPRPRALAGGFSDDSFASPQGAQPAPLASAGVSPHTVRPANWNSETKRSPTSNPFPVTKKSSRYSDPPCCSCECKNRKAFPNQNVFTIC